MESRNHYQGVGVSGNRAVSGHVAGLAHLGAKCPEARLEAASEGFGAATARHAHLGRRERNG